jgi:antitoxin ParD1/3/4
MPTNAIRVTLPDEMLALVKDKVASGEYASESEVISEGLRSLQDRDDEVSDWMLEQARIAYDAYKEDPTRGTPIDEVFARVKARHLEKRALKNRRI